LGERLKLELGATAALFLPADSFPASAAMSDGPTENINPPAESDGPAHRSVDIEQVRRYAQDQVELTSIRHIAAEAGLGRTTMHKFVAGETMPHPRVRRLLALWYLEARHGAEAARPAAALDVLVNYFPPEARASLIHGVLDQLEQISRGLEMEPPSWIPHLRTASM
jgi:hypothetical protein